tara:strand:- start:695 stop:1279 length:585 start_codon:yes stop_codon:yes gene_type:complete
MSVVNAQTVLSALDNLQNSYLISKRDMTSTLEKINDDLHTIEKCTETLLKNYSDKKELQDEIDKLVNEGKKAKELKQESDKIKIINEKVQQLQTQINQKELENKNLLKEIQRSTNMMKRRCVQKKEITGLEYGEKELGDKPEKKDDDDFANELDGGYKHSSRKSKSKSTRKRIRNKFKKIKIFTKKRRQKKKKK